MGTPLGPKYIPYTYMDPLGEDLLKTSKDVRGLRGLTFADVEEMETMRLVSEC